MDYKASILEHFGPQNISITDLIEYLVMNYGETKQDGLKTIGEQELESILTNLLTTDGLDAAYAMNNIPQFREVFNWHYDTRDGNGYITEKK